MYGERTPLTIGFLLSGGGRTLENLLEFLGSRPGAGRIARVIADRDGVFGLERARRHSIPTAVLPCRRANRKQDSSSIFQLLADDGVEVVLLGGFLKLLWIPPQWQRRVLNIHPSLIPRHCGEGYYGDRVHRSVLASGDPISGCTVHFVDNEYDHGSIVLQEEVPVEADDTPDTLAARVFEAECRAYPRALQSILKGKTALGPS